MLRIHKGGVAKWLGTALQKRLRRFNSARHLQIQIPFSFFIRATQNARTCVPQRRSRVREHRTNPNSILGGTNKEGKWDLNLDCRWGIWTNPRGSLKSQDAISARDSPKASEPEGRRAGARRNSARHLQIPANELSRSQLSIENQKPMDSTGCKARISSNITQDNPK